MKKYLSIICVLLTLTAFTSCSNTSGNQSEVSKNIVSENSLLSSIFENDYLKIAKGSEWEEDIGVSDNITSIKWDWTDESSHNISCFLMQYTSGKKSQEDLRKEFSENGEYYVPDRIIFDSFEKNGQAYIVLGAKDSETREIFFITDKVLGKFVYSSDDEEILIDMIDSIEFNDDISESSADSSFELDSDWECDYLKVATNSNWKEQSELNGKMFNVGWDWSESDDDKDFFPRIRLTVGGTSLGRKTQSELQAYGEEMVKDYTDPNSEYYDEYYKDYRVIETFTENGQSYLVMGDDSISLREIYFWTDDFWGYFYTSTNYEEIVRNMIETIEFY